MEQVSLKQISYGGVTMLVPEIWEVETEELQEFDGQKSYSIDITAGGKDVRSIDISFGPLPEGSDAYAEACGTYEEVVGEDGLEANDEPILCFDFKGKEAHGFSLTTDDNLPCFFFCVEFPQSSIADTAERSTDGTSKTPTPVTSETPTPVTNETPTPVTGEIPTLVTSETPTVVTNETKLLTVLLCAASNEDLQSLLDFVEEYLTV